MPEDDRPRQKQRLQAFVALLRRGLQMPVLDVPLFYPRDEFFDTAFHLTADGRRQRTLALVAALERAALLTPVDGGR